MTIRIISSKPEGIPDDPNKIDWKTNTKTSGGAFGGTAIQKVALKRRIAAVELVVSLLNELPCEFEITITSKDASSTTGGRIWVWDSEAELLIESLVEDLEAAVALLVQDYPDFSFSLTSERHPRI